MRAAGSGGRGTTLRRILVFTAFVVMVGSCSAGGPEAQIARLVIEVSLGDLTGTTRSSELVCRTDFTSGTGYLAFDQLAVEACDAITDDPAVAAFLAAGPDPGRVCDERYGGPQTARIRGVYAGARIERSVDRADGCGSADWVLLEPLLGPP